jgi:hypothetical protein
MYTCTNCNKQFKRNPKAWGSIVVALPVTPVFDYSDSSMGLSEVSLTGFTTRDVNIEVLLCRKCKRNRYYKVPIDGYVYKGTVFNLCVPSR